MKSVTYHIVLENDDFMEYAGERGFGRDDCPVLREESKEFDESAWEIRMRKWYNVPSEVLITADMRARDVSAAYGIPLEKIHIYRKMVSVDILKIR